MTHPPGMVIVPCGDLGRYHRFTQSLNDLKLPEGSQTVFAYGGSTLQNLNTGLDYLREEDAWVWAIGDDHVFEADTVMRLLERERDIIAPLCVQHLPPFALVHYDRVLDGTEIYNTIQIDELPDHEEPIEVEATGSAMLIRRHVIDELQRYSNSNGRTNEDLEFCARAREAGFKVWIDPAVWIGHIGIVTAYPQKRDGTWGLVLDFPGVGRNQIFYPGGIDPLANLGALRPKLELVGA